METGLATSPETPMTGELRCEETETPGRKEKRRQSTVTLVRRYVGLYLSCGRIRRQFVAFKLMGIFQIHRFSSDCFVVTIINVSLFLRVAYLFNCDSDR